MCKKMDKVFKLLPLLINWLCVLGFLIVPSTSESLIELQQQQPQAIKSLNLSLIENVESCSYTVIITTSCSSPRHTRDHISISFGDAYGNQIYAPRIDDPSTMTFERCSSDTFQITGPCAYQICYVYLYRTGSDGWMPETVKIDGYNSRTVTFVYNTFVPSGVWFGFDMCHSASSALSAFRSKGLLMYLFLGVIVIFLL